MATGALLDREIAQFTIEDTEIKRLMTTTGANLTVAAGIVAAIGSRFSALYFALNHGCSSTPTQCILCVVTVDKCCPLGFL
ncbi:hypothetical protein ACFFWD_07970 [Bradyrhizobium erythrophlei]|uniref:hypothetical protein n=1 Tax=Bradyrhizobium erythrophlei TaxID=1437360 RepID=UPI0035E4720B